MAEATKAKAVASAGEKNGHVMEPISLSEFRRNERKLTAMWSGLDRPIEFVYMPGMFDDAHYEALREDEDLPISKWAVKYCVRVLAAIPSLTEEDGAPLKITEENIARLPTGLLNLSLIHISEPTRLL